MPMMTREMIMTAITSLSSMIGYWLAAFKIIGMESIAAGKWGNFK